jgi:polysaccharide biosynthesis protein PslH
MKILQLVKWLSPKIDSGGKIRSICLSKALASFAEIDAMGYFRPGEVVSGEESQFLHYGKVFPFHFENAAWHSIKMIFGLAGSLSLRSTRFFDPAFRLFMENILRENRYDAIQVEELPLMSNLSVPTSNIPVIYSAHNVESQLSYMLFSQRNRLLKLLAGTERKRTIEEEISAVARSWACLVVSEKDRSALRKLDPSTVTPIHVIPNCADDRFLPSLRPVKKKEILFIGCFGWYPNAHGIAWFMDQILPHLKMLEPSCTIRVVGSEISRPMHRRLKQMGLHVHHDVADILPYLNEARLMFVPLKIGGGTRIKIVEAWTAGVPVVSTSVGVEGLDCRQGVNVLIADEPRQFARHIHQVLNDDSLYAKLRSEGLTCSQNLRWSAMAGRLEQIYALI